MKFVQSISIIKQVTYNRQLNSMMATRHSMCLDNNVLISFIMCTLSHLSVYVTDYSV